LVPFHVASSDVWDQTANCSTRRMVKATEFLEGQKIRPSIAMHQQRFIYLVSGELAIDAT